MDSSRETNSAIDASWSSQAFAENQIQSSQEIPSGLGETRNIIDHYHYWKHEAILADLDKRRNNYTVVCCNIGNDFNIATVVRNANAFLAKEVWVYGSKQWDRRGAVGTHNYTRMKHFPLFHDIKEKMLSTPDSQIVCIDNIGDAKAIEEFEWDPVKHYYIVLGQEQIGVPVEMLNLAQHCLYIKQYGSVRSLNVGTASGIVMSDYCNKALRKPIL